jgi:hypothetical protein
MRNVLLALLAITFSAVACRAAGPGRLFKPFDFEERQLGNDEDLPMHWSKLTGVDLPHYVVGRLTTDRARGGRYSFRLDLNGGNCIYQYDPGLMPITVGGHYRFTGFCQTAGLRNARARLTLAAADRSGQPLADAAVSSEPYAGDGDNWHALSTELTVTDPRAVYLLVQVELVQPARYGGTGADDIHGTAWFDDLAVAQVPRTSMSTARPGNVLRRGDEPAVSVLLADPSTDDVVAQLAITDVAGRPIYQRTGTVHVAAADDLGDGRRRFPLPLPITPAGWYRATLRLASPGEAGPAAWGGAETLDYVRLADDGAVVPTDARFGIVATALPPAAWPALPQVLPLLSAGRATLAVWGPEGGSLDDTLAGLSAVGIAPVGCLLAPPPSVAASWQQLAAGPVERWQTPLAVLVSAHSGLIKSWQIGPADGDAFATDPALRRVYHQASTLGAGLAGRFDLAMACPLGLDVPAGKAGPTSVALSIPSTVLPGELGAYLQDGATAGAPVASVAVEPIDADRYGSTARAADLAERVVYATAAGVARVDVPVPLTMVPPSTVDDPARSPVQANDLFPVERTLLTGLAGAASLGRVPLADGVQAFLFQRPGEPTGTIVLWADATGPAADRPVSVHLGNRLLRTDLWGNVMPLPTGRDLRVGPVPTLVSGVDVPLARFRAGLTLNQPRLEAVLLRPQVRRLHLSNPYPGPISGTVRLRGPAGWTLAPSTVTFQLAAGESLDRDVGINLPLNARAGDNRIVATADVTTDVGSVQLSIPLPMAVGLSDLGVQSTAFRDGTGLVVQQRITNYSDRPVDYLAYANCPGQPRAERLVVALAPGRSTLRRYTFPNIGPGPLTLRAGVRQSDGSRALNQELTVP